MPHFSAVSLLSTRLTKHVVAGFVMVLPCAASAATETVVPTQPTIGIAAFNMAWAGTADDFRQYLAVCGAPTVNWCDTRARTVRGASGPTPEEEMRAKACQAATQTAAGGQDASQMVAPCNAYRSSTPPSPGMPVDQGPLRTLAAYQGKLDGLRTTVEKLIEEEKIRVIAFQEVKSKAAIETVLGKFAARFDVCVATHNAFQTIAFAWDRSLTSRPGTCTTQSSLSIKDPPNDPKAFRRVRPGLALELTIQNLPVTFLNVHLKSGCANIVATDRFAARLLTDTSEACEVLNRQVPLLEDWIDATAKRSPRLVWLGDFNRRIDEEAAANISKNQVRTDGSDPSTAHANTTDGKSTARYLWPEIADGVPVALHQVPLPTTEGGCTGFQGLDHVVISDLVKKANPGTIPSRKVAVHVAQGQKMETSDHCPRVVQLRF